MAPPLGGAARASSVEVEKGEAAGESDFSVTDGDGLSIDTSPTLFASPPPSGAEVSPSLNLLPENPPPTERRQELARPRGGTADNAVSAHPRSSLPRANVASLWKASPALRLASSASLPPRAPRGLAVPRRLPPRSPTAELPAAATTSGRVRFTPNVKAAATNTAVHAGALCSEARGTATSGGGEFRDKSALSRQSSLGTEREGKTAGDGVPGGVSLSGFLETSRALLNVVNPQLKDKLPQERVSSSRSAAGGFFFAGAGGSSRVEQTKSSSRLKRPAINASAALPGDIKAETETGASPSAGSCFLKSEIEGGLQAVDERGSTSCVIGEASSLVGKVREKQKSLSLDALGGGSPLGLGKEALTYLPIALPFDQLPAVRRPEEDGRSAGEKRLVKEGLSNDVVCSSLQDLPSGRFGRLEVRRSGKASLKLCAADGLEGVELRVSPGCSLRSDQQCGVLLNNELIFLGNCAQRLVAAPVLKRG